MELCRNYKSKFNAHFNRIVQIIVCYINKAKEQRVSFDEYMNVLSTPVIHRL